MDDAANVMTLTLGRMMLVPILTMMDTPSVNMKMIGSINDVVVNSNMMNITKMPTTRYLGISPIVLWNTSRVIWLLPPSATS